MEGGDPLPFPELLDAARPGLVWAVEWIYKEDTAFARWAQAAGLTLTGGAALFEAQAKAQARRFPPASPGCRWPRGRHSLSHSGWQRATCSLSETAWR